jgi:thioesterase domain-containing protein
MVNGTADVWDRVKRKIKSFRDQGKAASAETSFSAEVGGFFDLSRVSEEHRHFMERYYVALWRYVPKAYEGAVLLVKARTQPLYHLIEPEKAWPAIAKDLDIHVMPCTHLSIVREPHVRDVATLIKSKVAAIAARYASSAAVNGRAVAGSGGSGSETAGSAAPAETTAVSS